MSHGNKIRLIVLAMFWGSSYVLIELALRDFTPSVVAFGRQFVASLVLAPFIFWFIRSKQARNHIVTLIGLAVVMVGAPTIFIAMGQQYVSASLAGILVATSPLFTALGALLWDESQRSGTRQLSGLVIGLVGVSLVFRADLWGDAAQMAGGMLILLASIGYTLGGFIVKKYFSNIRTAALVGCTSGISALLLLPVAVSSLIVTMPEASFLSLGSLILLGLSGTALGWYLYYSIVQTDGPRAATLVQYLTPGVAVALGTGLLGEPLTVSILAGFALIMLGVYLAAGSRGARHLVRT